MPEEKSLSIAFLFDDTLDSTDGVAQYVKTLGRWYSENGHRVAYLCGDTQMSSWYGGRVYSLSRNLKVSWGGNKLSVSLIPKISLIKKILKDNEFDIVHVQIPYSPFMAQRVIKRLNSKTALVGTVHIFPASSLSLTGSKLLKFIYGDSFRRFNFIASVSSAAQDYSYRAFGIQTEVIPNTISLEQFKPSRIPKQNRRKIVFLGRLVKRKGAEYLIRAFATIESDFDDVQLVIAGDGKQRKTLERLVNNLNLNDRVDFLGFVKEEDKPNLLASAEIACFPALYGESFGIVLIEAMSAGAGVVIGGNNPGYISVLNFEPKTIVNPRNTEGFSKRLAEFLSSKNLADKVHESQQIKVKQYDINKVGSDWLEHYYGAIAKRQKTRHN